MSVLSEQNVAVLFTTSDPETGAATDADALPVGTLHRNGEATEDVVQITKAQTGLYKVAVSLPECDPGDMLSISVSATVGDVAASAVVWEDTVQMAVPVASVGADAIDYDSLDTGAVNRIWEFLVADETPASVVMHALNIVAPRLLSMIEADDVDWRFTEGALAEAPTGGGGATAAGDPWTAVLPGEYDEGTAGALLPQLAGALAALGAHDVTVVSPVSECGAVLIHAGDDYKAADGRGVVFTVADAGHLLRLDEAGALLRFKCRQGTWTATMVASTPAGYTVTFEPTRVQTAVLTGAQPYELEATQADGDVITLAVGRLEVARDIPTLPS